MDISGLVQSYDSRASSSAAMNRAIIAPQYVPVSSYSSATSGGLIATHQQPLLQQQTQYNFGAYTTGASNGLVPAFANNYIQQRPLSRLVQPERNGDRVSYQQNQRRDFVEEHLTQSPVIKVEPQWNSQTNSPTFVSAGSKNITSVPENSSAEINFRTEVDTLMKTIQAKSQTTQPQPKSSPIQSRPVDDFHSQKGGKKRYQCTINGCLKSFYQKTHLDIHERAHTGDKPYPCKKAGCGRSFSQLGNLKTHERRHTGERPYKCDICDKRFAQRGNVRAHRIVHEQAKPYLCRLDDCGKQFTQLGNLKSHQNKFHIATIRTLTSKFASIQDGDIVPAADKELWEYFANLYKNSNKGIKGRGKDRKVGPNHMSLNSGLRGLNSSGGYSMSGSGRGNTTMGVIGTGMGGGGRGDSASSHYDMFDADDESQASSHSGSASSVGTCYDDAPSDGFEENGRGGDLAFGDRIY